MQVKTRYIRESDFRDASNIFKIISHKINNTFVSFQLINNDYYIGYPSGRDIQVEFLYLEKENFLLVGIDLQVVVLCTKTGRILFSIGLYSYFRRFSNESDLTFVISSETEDIIINKEGLSISEIVNHQLDI